MTCSQCSLPLSPGMWTDELITPKSVRIQDLFMIFSVIFCMINNFTISIVKTIQVNRLLSSDRRVLIQLPNRTIQEWTK